MLQAVIFDMDGVIIDSEPIYEEINRQIFSELGIKVDQKKYSQYIGVTNQEMWSDIKREYSLPFPVNKLKEMQLSRSLEYMREGNKEPIPGIWELLNDLKKRDIYTALASSSSRQLVEVTLAGLQLDGYFDVMLSGDNVSRGKPEPEIFYNTASLLQVSPHCCIVIEDSNHGVKAAKAAGMICIGFQNPNSIKQDLTEADFIVDDLSVINFNYLQKIISSK